MENNKQNLDVNKIVLKDDTYMADTYTYYDSIFHVDLDHIVDAEDGVLEQNCIVHRISATYENQPLVITLIEDIRWSRNPDYSDDYDNYVETNYFVVDARLDGESVNVDGRELFEAVLA